MRAEFVRAYNNLENPCVRASTGFAELDEILFGIELGRSYLLYSDDGFLADSILFRLAVNSLLPVGGGGFGRPAVMIVCSDYHNDRTLVDTFLMADLMKSRGLDYEEYFEQIAVAGCFSADQLDEASKELPTLIRGLDAKLVALLQPVKLTRNLVEISWLNGILWRIWSTCMENNSALLITSKCSGKRRFGKIPLPLGSYLKHMAETIIYFEKSSRNDYFYARVVKHPMLPQIKRSFEVKLWGE